MREYKNYMIRPRPYISWSQLSMLEASEKTYKKIYLNGCRLPINRGMALGTEIADALETETATGNIIHDLVIASIPKLSSIEKELTGELNFGKIKIPLFGKADTANKTLTSFKEYKTGKTAWNQDKVDKHGQITFYCVIIKTITGKIPKDIELVWAPTEELPDGRYNLTGEIKRFKTQRNLTDVLKMQVRIKKAWERIGEICDEALI